MTNDKQELISAMVDDELRGSDADAFVDLINDPETSDIWRDYHLIRDALQSKLPQSIDCQLASKIHQAIASEPTVIAPKSFNRQPYLKPVAGFAIAASVMAAALLGVQSWQQTDNTIPAVPVANNQPFNQSLVQPVTLADEASQPQVNPVNDLSANPRMNRYLMNYNEMRASSTVQGMPPYVRMIGYEAE